MHQPQFVKLPTNICCSYCEGVVLYEWAYDTTPLFFYYFFGSLLIPCPTLRTMLVLLYCAIAHLFVAVQASTRQFQTVNHLVSAFEELRAAS